VESVQRRRQFYERLGWHRSSASNESIVFFRAGGIALALCPLAELAKDANLSADGQGFGGITLAYNESSRDDVDLVLSEAVKAEATLLKPAQERSGADIRDTSPTRTDSLGRRRRIRSRSPQDDKRIASR